VSRALFRVDERLIHGQVVVGWGRRLNPNRIVVVSDSLSREPVEQDIYRTGLPASIEAVFWNLDEAINGLPAALDSEESIIVLTEDLETMMRLASGGVPITEVNVGGLYASEGRTRLLPYVWFGAQDEQRMRELETMGVRVVAQDLPTTAPVRLQERVG
jgi:mannose/fructose/N-acetylgalactosamine-specific phosphotransferase system component IIB